MRVDINDLPERYRKQIREKFNKKNRVTNSASNVEQNSSNASVGKKKVERHTTPVCIHVHSVRKRLADSDGISAKAVIDGLVKSKILKDDSTKYVEEVRFSQEKTKGEEKTIIYLYKSK